MAITIEEAKKQMHEKAMKAMKEAGFMLESEVKMVTPVDTGALRRSITNKTTDEGSKITTEIGSYGIEYAYIVDQRQPFLESTVDSNLPQIRKKIQEVLSK